MDARSCFQFIAEHGAGHADRRTARNVLEIVVPAARQWACTADEHALINAAQQRAQAVMDGAEVTA